MKTAEMILEKHLDHDVNVLAKYKSVTASIDKMIAAMHEFRNQGISFPSEEQLDLFEKMIGLGKRLLDFEDGDGDQNYKTDIGYAQEALDELRAIERIKNGKL